MSKPSDFDRLASAWLADGPTELADRVLEAALHEVHVTHQRRRWAAPWRTPLMSLRPGTVALIALVAVVGMGVFAYLGRAPGFGSASEPPPTRLETPLPSVTSPAAPTAAPSAVDTTAWVPYESTRYGFTLSHPAGWDVRPATRAWTWELDAEDWRSPAQDAFVSLAGSGIRVSAWSVPLDPGEELQSLAEFETWVAAYCEASGNTPCDGIHERAIPLCIERRDCHPALLVPFEDDVQAFLSGGIYDPARMTIVAVWWADSAPAVASYGGSQKLLEAFLSTMSVWPESVPFDQRQ